MRIENASAFGKANDKLMAYLLKECTAVHWIPETQCHTSSMEGRSLGLSSRDGGGEGGNCSTTGNGKAREDQRKVAEFNIDWMYGIFGDMCLEDGGVNVNAILDASPMLETSLGWFWQLPRFFQDMIIFNCYKYNFTFTSS